MLLLLGDLLAQPCKLGALRNGQRLLVAGGRSLDAAPLIGDPPTEQSLVEGKLTRDLGDRAARIDYPMGGLDLALGRKRPTGTGHDDILPAGPFIPLSRCPPLGGNLSCPIRDILTVRHRPASL